MAFGMQTSGGDFLPIIKYDARAGKLFRVDRNMGGGNDAVELPQGTKFALDFGSLEVGYVDFTAQGPVRHMVPFGATIPAQPSDKNDEGKVRFRPGFYAKVAGQSLDGLREWCSNAAVLLNALDDLWNTFAALPESGQGKIPLISIIGSTPVKSGKGAQSSTNYAPIFKINGWIDRPDLFGARTVPAPRGTAQQAAPVAPVAPVAQPAQPAAPPVPPPAAPPASMPF